jgi:hypothetical protein
LKFSRNVVTNINLVVIGLVGLAILLFSWKNSNDSAQWWKDASLNLGTGFISSVILIFLYEKMQRKFDEIDKTKRLTTGIRRLINQLEWIWTGCFCFLHDEGLSLLDIRPFKNYEDFFDEAFYLRIKNLDLNSVCYSNPDHPIWLSHFLNMYKSMSNEFSTFLSIYEPYLEIRIADLVDNLQHSDFMAKCSVLMFQRGIDMIKPPIYPTDEMMNALRNDVKAFIEICEYCNKHLPDSASFYNRKVWFVKK